LAVKEAHQALYLWQGALDLVLPHHMQDLTTSGARTMTRVKTLMASTVVATAMLGTAAQAADIVDTAASAGQFETLVAAVQAAGLVETLKGEGPFTVFAPTDEAFAKLPEGTVDNLLKPENKDQLVEILTYHVVPGKTMSSDIAGQELEVETVQGETIAIDAANGAVMINDAQVVQADIETDNGVIHVIDTVIMPAS
jgi:uncharacterized surface protein with fasciclin (FAS1) repeats